MFSFLFFVACGAGCIGEWTFRCSIDSSRRETCLGFSASRTCAPRCHLPRRKSSAKSCKSIRWSLSYKLRQSMKRTRRSLGRNNAVAVRSARGYLFAWDKTCSADRSPKPPAADVRLGQIGGRASTDGLDSSERDHVGQRSPTRVRSLRDSPSWSRFETHRTMRTVCPSRTSAAVAWDRSAEHVLSPRKQIAPRRTVQHSIIATHERRVRFIDCLSL